MFAALFGALLLSAPALGHPFPPAADLPLPTSTRVIQSGRFSLFPSTIGRSGFTSMQVDLITTDYSNVNLTMTCNSRSDSFFSCNATLPNGSDNIIDTSFKNVAAFAVTLAHPRGSLLYYLASDGSLVSGSTMTPRFATTLLTHTSSTSVELTSVFESNYKDLIVYAEASGQTPKYLSLHDYVCGPMTA